MSVYSAPAHSLEYRAGGPRRRRLGRRANHLGLADSRAVRRDVAYVH